MALTAAVTLLLDAFARQTGDADAYRMLVRSTLRTFREPEPTVAHQSFLDTLDHLIGGVSGG